MSQLTNLIASVKDENLDKTQLEDYYTNANRLKALMKIEMADLMKDEAIFMGQKADGQSAIDRKIQWKATEKGLRLIELKNFVGAINPMIDGLKTRIYSKL